MKKQALTVLLIPLIFILSACTGASEDTNSDVVLVPYEDGAEEVLTHEIRTDQGVTFQFGKDYDPKVEGLREDASIFYHKEEDISVLVQRGEHSQNQNRYKDIDHQEYFTSSYDYVEMDTQPFEHLSQFGFYKLPTTGHTLIVMFKDLNEQEFLIVSVDVYMETLPDNLRTELLAFLNTIEIEE